LRRWPDEILGVVVVLSRGTVCHMIEGDRYFPNEALCFLSLQVNFNFFSARVMDIVKSQVIELKKLWANKRQLSFQALNLAMIVFSALMIWKGLMVVTKSESPVVVVLR
jgi:hypothetical protein